MADTSANFNISRFKDVIGGRQGGLTKGTFFVCSISPGANAEELGFEFKQDDLLVCKAVNLPAEQLNFTTLKYHTRAIKIPTTREFGPMTLSFYNTGNYNLRSNFFKWMNLYNSAVGNVRGLQEIYLGDRPSNIVRDAANSGNFKGTNSYTKMFATMELVSFTNDGKLKAADLLKVLGQIGIGAAQGAVSRIGGRVGGILGGAAGLAANHFKNKLEIESNNRPLASYKFTYAFPTNIGPLQFSYDDDTSFQTYDVEFQYLDMRYEDYSVKSHVRTDESIVLPDGSLAK